MFTKNLIFVKIILITFSIQVFCKNPVITINTKKLLHTSDATFLSYIVDYNSTAQFIAKGFSSTQLAQTLSPSSIRITDVFSNINSSNFTIQKWNSLNDWFIRSNLNPIYVIDSEVVNRSSDLFPFLKANKEPNTIFWELHYDCGNVNENILLNVRELLNVYPEMIKNLKIVQSNLSFCFSDQNQELLHNKLIKELNYSVDVMTYEERINMNETKTVENFYTKAKIPIWLRLENQNETLNFEETLIWFNKIEKLGRNGFAAIFRQNKWDGLIADNPLYWITMIYKSLVSPKILEIRQSKSRDPDFYVYAHCTNHQNKFSAEDSLTIIATNCGLQYQNFTIRISPPHSKSIEVLSYIVSSDESTSTFLNGEKLIFESIFNNHTLKPKVSSVRVINHMVPLSLSENSIGFFIIKTKVSACINKTYNSVDNFKLNENLINQIGEDSQKYVTFEEMTSNNSELTKNPTSKILNLEIVYAKQPDLEVPTSVKKIELKLTDDEIKQILLNRAKAKANELNVIITSKEIENEILREVKNLTEMEQERPKRDINMKELKKHTSKMQMNPKIYDKVNNYDFQKKHLRYNEAKVRYAEYDDEEVTKKYMEDNVKFLMGPNYSSEKSDSSYDTRSRETWSSTDIDEENVRNAVRLLENYMENSKSSEESRNHYKFGRRYKRSLNDDQIKKYKQFMRDQLRIISNLRKNPIYKIGNFQRTTLNFPEIKMLTDAKFSTQNFPFRELKNSASHRFKRTNGNDSTDFNLKRFNKHNRKNAVPKIKNGFKNKKRSKNFAARKQRIHSKRRDKRSMDDLINSMENEIDDLSEFKKSVRLEITPTQLEKPRTKSNIANLNKSLNNPIIIMETTNCSYLEIKKHFNLDSITEYIKDLFASIYNKVINYFNIFE